VHGMQKVRGSNPLSSTQVRGQLDNPTGPFLMPVPQPVPQRPYAAVCEYPSSRAHAITFQPHGLTAVAAARQAWGSARITAISRTDAAATDLEQVQGPQGWRSTRYGAAPPESCRRAMSGAAGGGEGDDGGSHERD
jgi:hypothetical protein